MIKKKGLSYLIITICFVCAMGTAFTSALRIYREFNGIVDQSYMTYVMSAHVISAVIWLVYMMACAKAEKLGKAHVVIAVIVLSSTLFGLTMMYSITDFQVHPENYEMEDVSGNAISESSISTENIE